RRTSSASGDPDVDEAIQRIRGSIIHIADSGIPSVIGTKIVSDFDELQDARNARLGLKASAIDPSKWYLLLSLTLITSFTVAVLHAERPVAGKIASLIFSLTALCALW